MRPRRSARLRVLACALSVALGGVGTAGCSGKSGRGAGSTSSAVALRFVAAPAQTPPEVDLPALTVEVIDAAGQRVTGASAPVTLSIGTNPGGARLAFRAPGAAQVNASAGLATFVRGGLDRAGSGYTLVASSPGLTSAISPPFDVAAVPALDGTGHLDSGQMNFDRGAIFDTPNPSSFDQPSAVLVDQADHRLFLADTGNHRVLVFELSSSDGLRADRRHASWVLGQQDMTGQSPGLAGDRLDTPVGLAYDPGRKRLYVADLGNHRVLAFDLSSGIASGMTAAVVLGQATFTTKVAATTRAGLSSPVALLFDAGADRLYVGELGNRRVVAHATVGLASGQDATAVLGQPDFTSATAAVTRAGLSAPDGLALDAAGARLFVSDSGANRVLIYDVQALTDGEDAAGVLGQSDFTSGGAAATASGLSAPYGLAFEAGAGRLFVSDYENDRVLVFDAQAPDGVAATGVLGHADFVTSGTSRPPLPTRASLWGPAGLCVSGGTLWVAEDQASRVVAHAVGALVDGQDALDGLGHTDGQVMVFNRFGHDGGQATPHTFGSVQGGVALDPDGHRLFAVDTSQNRVLVFQLSANDDFVGQSRVAYAVLGQPDEVGFLVGTLDERGLYEPVGVAWDRVLKRLYVADSTYNRVLGFEESQLVTHGQATLVLGQPDFTSRGAGPASATTLRRPVRVAVDPGQRVFVADADNHRVLVYDNAASLTNGAAATSAIGQADLTGGAPGLAADRLDGPGGLAYDPASERLFVADTNNDRVLVFDLGSSAGSGRSALLVLGQPDLTAAGAATSREGLSAPEGLALDPAAGRLYVADAGNHRVVVHELAGLSDGQQAVSYLGQEAGFGVATAGLGEALLSTPRDVTFVPGQGRLFTIEGGNHRVLLLPAPSP